eukprot:Rhum_TRINITY_DN171_c0_g1::Rhum_TRINITY_DN171_c0_g1_i1::g.402::m.402
MSSKHILSRAVHIKTFAQHLRIPAFLEPLVIVGGGVGVAALFAMVHRWHIAPSSSPMYAEVGNKNYMSGDMYVEEAQGLDSLMRILENTLDPSDRLVCLGKFLPDGRKSIQLGMPHRRSDGMYNMMQQLRLLPKEDTHTQYLVDPKKNAAYTLFEAKDLMKVPTGEEANVPALAPVPLPPSYIITGKPAELKRLNIVAPERDTFLTYLSRDAVYAMGLCVLGYGINRVQFGKDGSVKCASTRTIADAPRPLDEDENPGEAGDSVYYPQSWDATGWMVAPRTVM